MIIADASKVELILELIIASNFHLQQKKASDTERGVGGGGWFHHFSSRHWRCRLANREYERNVWLWVSHEHILTLASYHRLDPGTEGFAANFHLWRELLFPTSLSRASFYLLFIFFFLFFLAFHNLFSCWCVIIALYSFICRVERRDSDRRQKASSFSSRVKWTEPTRVLQRTAD